MRCCWWWRSGWRCAGCGMAHAVQVTTQSERTAVSANAARLDRDWPRRLPLLIFVAKTGAGPIRWIHTARPARCARVLRAPGRRQQLGSPGRLRRRLHRRSAPSRETAMGARPDVGNVANPVSADLAVFPRGAHGSAVIRSARLSGPLHDLLPACTPDSGGRRAGTAAPIVAACGRAHRNIVSGLAGNLFRLRPRLRQRAGRLRSQPLPSFSTTPSRETPSSSTSPEPASPMNLSAPFAPEKTPPARVSRLNSARRFCSPTTAQASTTATSPASPRRISCARPRPAIRGCGLC